MSDNTKNGIIDLTEIVEMGTPPDPAPAQSIPTSPAGTVDFESELEDLFSSTDFSEFTDSTDSSSQPAASANADIFPDTPASTPAVEDILADLAPEVAASPPVQDIAAEAAPSFESDLDALLDSADSKDSSVGFDADFEDLLSEFSDSPTSSTAPAYQPDFEEDLSSMSLGSADPEPVVAEPAPQPQAVAPEPVHATESNIADVNAADVDDLFADLDFELGEAPAAPAAEAKSAPVEAPPVAPAEQSAFEEDDLFAGFDFELDPMESAPIEAPAPRAASFTAEEPQASADDDLFADLGLEFDLDELDAKPAAAPQVKAPEMESPVAAPTPAPATESNIADVNASDVDDLFSDLDFELGEMPGESVPASVPASTPEPVAPPVAAASPSPVDNTSLDDPFDVDDILSEFSDDVTPQPTAEAAEDFDLADLDELLRVDNEPAQAPRTDLTPADGTTLDSEEVEMDDIGFLLSEFDDNGGTQAAASAPQPQPEPVFAPEPPVAPEFAFEPAAPVEPVVSEVAEPAAPVDGSMFDAEIDALLDDLEMASVEPIAPISQEPSAPVAEPIVESVADPVMEPVAPQFAQPDDSLFDAVSDDAALSAEPESLDTLEDDFDLDALLDNDQSDGEVAPEFATPEMGAALDVEDDLGAEIDALLNEVPQEAPAAPEVQAVAEEMPEEQKTASPLGSADEFESILDELDSLLDEQEALEPAMEAASVDPVDELLATPVEDVLQDDAGFDFDSEPELDFDPEPMVDMVPEPVMEAAPVVPSAPEFAPEPVAAAPVFEEAATVEPDLEMELGQLTDPTSLEEDLDSTLDRILGDEPLSMEDVVEEAPQQASEQAAEPAAFTHDDIDALLADSEISEEPVMEMPVPEEPVFEAAMSEDLLTEELIAEEVQPEAPAFEEPAFMEEAPVVEEPMFDAPEAMESTGLEQEMFAQDNAVEPELPVEPAVEEMMAAPDFEDIAGIAEEPVAEFAAEQVVQQEEPQDSLEEPNSVSEAMDAMEDDIPLVDLEQEAMADLESLTEIQPESLDAPEELLDSVDMTEEGFDAGLNMDDINENASPVPPNASIEDLMRESSVDAPEFSDASMEMLDTMPAVSSAIQNDPAYDVPPAPAMTPEEFAELTERIYYLESTLQNVIAMQESFVSPEPPAVEKKVLVKAIDEAFNMDGPLMARVLSAVEVRTETLIESMGTRIESQIKGAIEQTAAKSAAQVIREELQALLAEDFT
ncbi:MAG: hypothetical protein ACERJ1_00835 [Halodesulfovibrio sp.]|uniref:hypothetical protein n=1 Tax=Halodesulfovibrio sp. TaxID=1912772 RepID=UPI00359E0273